MDIVTFQKFTAQVQPGYNIFGFYWAKINARARGTSETFITPKRN